MLPAPTTTRHLDPPLGHLVDLGRDPLDPAGIGAVVEGAHQGLAGELQQDSVERG